ncbi:MULTISPECIES: hypothetical protein [unclassified Spiroplasma]|uniref:hypothetical protein n=1 Tax=unclassified Spiroplasma TaxID=2637901 RepID=UPI00313BD92F
MDAKLKQELMTQYTSKNKLLVYKMILFFILFLQGLFLILAIIFLVYNWISIATIFGIGLLMLPYAYYLFNRLYNQYFYGYRCYLQLENNSQVNVEDLVFFKHYRFRKWKKKIL